MAAIGVQSPYLKLMLRENPITFARPKLYCNNAIKGNYRQIEYRPGCDRALKVLRSESLTTTRQHFWLPEVGF